MQASSWAMRHIFIRGMGLRDVAGAADHRRAAGLLEQPGLGPVGHRLRVLGAGERERQRDGLRSWPGEEGRHATLMSRCRSPASCATRRMRGNSAVSAKASRSLRHLGGRRLGRLRTCQWNSQVFGTMLGAVPPLMVPTYTVE